MVVIDFPITADTGVEQARVGAPSTCTVQAPHNAMPQPNFVPTSPSVSRNTHSSGVFGSTLSADSSLPFTCRLSALMYVPWVRGGTIVAGGRTQGQRPWFRDETPWLAAAPRKRVASGHECVACISARRDRR